MHREKCEPKNIIYLIDFPNLSNTAKIEISPKTGRLLLNAPQWLKDMCESELWTGMEFSKQFLVFLQRISSLELDRINLLSISQRFNTTLSEQSLLKILAFLKKYDSQKEG